MMSFGAIGIIIVIVRVVLFCNLQGVSILLVKMAKVGSLFGGNQSKETTLEIVEYIVLESYLLTSIYYHYQWHHHSQHHPPSALQGSPRMARLPIAQTNIVWSKN